MPYLRAKDDFTFDIQLEASLQTSSMNAAARHHALPIFKNSVLEHCPTARPSHN